jgi:hypothetical protein
MGGAGVLYLRPSRDQVAGDPLERRGALSVSLCKGRRTGQAVEEIMLPRRRANKSQPVTLRHFSHWPRRIGSVEEGPAGSKWSSVRPEARPGGVVQEGEE